MEQYKRLVVKLLHAAPGPIPAGLQLKASFREGLRVTAASGLISTGGGFGCAERHNLGGVWSGWGRSIGVVFVILVVQNAGLARFGADIVHLAWKVALSLQFKADKRTTQLRNLDGRPKERREVHSVGEWQKIDRVLNLSGLLCPNPNLIAAKKLEDMRQGEIIEVVCSGKLVKESIPALCGQGNYELLETREEKGLVHFIIRK